MAAFMTSRIGAEVPPQLSDLTGDDDVTVALPEFLRAPFSAAMSQSVLLPAFIALFGIAAALFLVGYPFGDWPKTQGPQRVYARPMTSWMTATMTTTSNSSWSANRTPTPYTMPVGHRRTRRRWIPGHCGSRSRARRPSTHGMANLSKRGAAWSTTRLRGTDRLALPTTAFMSRPRSASVLSPSTFRRGRFGPAYPTTGWRLGVSTTVPIRTTTPPATVGTRLGDRSRRGAQSLPSPAAALLPYARHSTAGFRKIGNSPATHMSNK